MLSIVASFIVAAGGLWALPGGVLMDKWGPAVCAALGVCCHMGSLICFSYVGEVEEYSHAVALLCIGGFLAGNWTAVYVSSLRVIALHSGSPVYSC